MVEGDGSIVRHAPYPCQITLTLYAQVIITDNSSILQYNISDTQKSHVWAPMDANTSLAVARPCGFIIKTDDGHIMSCAQRLNSVERTIPW